MLKRLVALAAVVAALSALPGVPALSGSAQADPLTPYDLCMVEAYYGCFPRDEFGNIRPPNLGDIDEAMAFEACTAAAYAACSGLPGDPNG